jgi:hypothetical protein
MPPVFRVGLPLAKRRLVIGKYHRFATRLERLTNHLSLITFHLFTSLLPFSPTATKQNGPGGFGVVAAAIDASKYV